MQLSRASVTRASRIMLPFYVVINAAFGLIWLFQDPMRSSRPPLDLLSDIWPLAGTGVVMLVLAATIAIGLLLRARVVLGVALAAGAVAYFCLGLVFVVSLDVDVQSHWPLIAIGEPETSLSIPLWPWGFMMMHVASLISVAFEETSAYQDEGTVR